MVGELEAMYVEMPDGHGIVSGTHVSKFAELYLQGFSENKLSMFFLFSLSK